MRAGAVQAFGLALACLLVAGYFALNARDAGRVQHANEFGAAGDYARAISTARSVSSGPFHSGALLVEGQAAIALGDYGDAIRALQLARSANPDDWSVHLALAGALLGASQRAAAVAELNAAKRLNPLLVTPPEFARR